MRKKLLVIQVAALDAAFEWPGQSLAPMQAAFPAVTCTASATFRTAELPARHGMVANGRYFSELHRPLFWEQSADLVEGERIWAPLREAGGKAGMLFWQQSLGESVDVLLSPAPIHKHHGGMIMDCYSQPPGLYDRLKRSLGPFKLGRYWGPLASEAVGDWIAVATAEVMADGDLAPDLLMTYLPSLDYQLQRHGPGHKRCEKAAATTAAQLDTLTAAAERAGYDWLVFGDYAIGGATGVARPNLALREAGLFATRDVAGMAYPDFHTSRAFAVVDHEIAHVHVGDPADLPAAEAALAALPGVGRLLDRAAQAEIGTDHPHGGDLLAIAAEGCWFAYPWWTDRREAPDFATHVDIHNKPGFDPCELLFGFPPPNVSTDANRIGGTHGRVDGGREVGFATSLENLPQPDNLLDLARSVAEYVRP